MDVERLRNHKRARDELAIDDLLRSSHIELDLCLDAALHHFFGFLLSLSSLFVFSIPVGIRCGHLLLREDEAFLEVMLSVSGAVLLSSSSTLGRSPTW